MGISIRAYGRHRGVSDAAVRKAIKAGRITPEPDGTIEPSRVDAEWRCNTDSAQQRSQAREKAVPVGAINAVREVHGEAPLPSGGTTFLQARTANEVLKAQTHKVRLARLKGDVVDRSQALAHVFTLARAERATKDGSNHAPLRPAEGGSHGTAERSPITTVPSCSSVVLRLARAASMTTIASTEKGELTTTCCGEPPYIASFA